MKLLYFEPDRFRYSLTMGCTMPFAISIIIAGQKVEAELNDSETSLAIVDALPIEADFNVWGDEIYFPIPVDTGLENGKEIVEVGDLCYWPPGKAFCIFYGATPGSTEDEIKPASPVNPVGSISGDAKVFKRLSGKSRSIRIERS